MFQAYITKKPIKWEQYLPSWILLMVALGNPMYFSLDKKCAKSAGPRYSEPFIVLNYLISFQHIGSSAYHLGLPSVIKAIFHINCLK